MNRFSIFISVAMYFSTYSLHANIAINAKITDEAITNADVNEIAPDQNLNSETPNNLPKEPIYVYIVSAGDSILRISEECGIEINRLQELNPILEQSPIIVGMELRLDSECFDEKTVVDFEDNNDISVAGNQDAVNDTPNADFPTYTVVSGDSIEAISSFCNIDIERLHEINPELRSLGIIYVGMELRVDQKCFEFI